MPTDPPQYDAGSVLVGDIGGTNARFAIVHQGALLLRKSYRCAEFSSGYAAIDAYLAGTAPERRPAFVSLAVAGPVRAGSIAFTNNTWHLSERELLERGFEQARLLNDFAALALAIPAVDSADMTSLGGPAAGQTDATIAVVGPGTGFGVAALVRDGFGHAVATTEGGHVAFAPGDAEETAVLQLLKKEFGRVSIERLLSGPGLANLHHALTLVGGGAAERLDAAEITHLARSGEPRCVRTVRSFCGILGSVAGDFALSFGARGGVCIAGGVAARMKDLLVTSAFRERFEAKGRFTDYNRAIPTWLLDSPDAALIGAASALRP